MGLLDAFHGPQFIASSITRVDAAVWIFLVAVCAVLFVGDVTEIFQAYLRHDAATSFRLSRDEGVTLPEPVICFDIDRKLFSLRVSNFVKGKKPSDFKRFIENLNGTDRCSVDDVTRGPDEVLEATYLLLTSYMDNDVENSHYVELYSTRLLHVLRAVEACFKRTNVDLFALTRSVASIIFSRFNLTVRERPISSEPIWLGPRLLASSNSSATDLLCHKLFGDAFILRHPLEFRYIYSEVYRFKRIQSQNKTKSGMYFRTAEGTSLDPNGDELSTAKIRFGVDGVAGIMAPSDAHEAVKFYPIYTRASVRVRTISAFERYPRVEQPCENRTRLRCASGIKLREIFDSRKCWSLSFFGSEATPPNVTACTSLTRMRQELNRRDWQNCFDQCPPPCGQTIYSVTPTVESSTYLQMISKLTIYPEPVPSPILTEHLKLDLVGLFAAIGGSSGLWLGGSLFALAHLIAFPIQYLARKMQRRLEKRTANASDDETTVFDRYVMDKVAAFCERSPLIGFSFVSRSQARIANLFWLALSVTFLVMTVRDVSTLVEQFRTEPVGLTTSLVQNKTARLDNLSLCFSVDFEEALANVARFVDIVDPGQLNKTIARFALNGTLQSTPSFPNIVLQLLHIDLLAVANSFMGCRARTDPINAVYERNYFNKKLNLSDALQVVEFQLKRVRDVLQKHEISYDTLNEYIAIYLCLIRNVSVSVRRFDEHLGEYTKLPFGDVCKAQRVRFFADCVGSESLALEHRTCFRLVDDVGFRSAARDKLIVRYDYEQRPSESDFLALWSTVSLDLRGGVGATDVGYADGFSRSGSLAVSIGGEFNVRDRCASGDQRECTERCHYRSIRSTRLCTPVEYARYAPSGESICSQALPFNEMLVEQANESEIERRGAWHRCASECKRACDVQLFELQRRTPFEYRFECNLPFGCNAKRKTIVVAIRERAFLRVDERPASNVEDILFSIGGAIALWLGASVVTLLHVPMHIVFALFRKGDKDEFGQPLKSQQEELGIASRQARSACSTNSEEAVYKIVQQACGPCTTAALPTIVDDVEQARKVVEADVHVEAERSRATSTCEHGDVADSSKVKEEKATRVAESVPNARRHGPAKNALPNSFSLTIEDLEES